MKAQTVFINEISICNISKELDPNYDYRGWIELYNATQTEIDLSKLYYSDEPGKPTKYRLLKSRILPAGGYASIWINDEITNNNGLYLDTDTDGGFLSIADANGTILESINYPIQHTNVSWGRAQDGENEYGYFINSSHNRSNNTSLTAFFVVAEPTFSLKGGFYSAPVSVSIECKTEDAKIYYTLDGSDPTPQKNLYTGSPIHIDSSRPLRAKAFTEGYLEGTIATATYMINERVPELPVLFLTTDTINLYNDTIGIYCVGTNGVQIAGTQIIANYGRDWTRPAHLEYLEKNKVCLDQEIGISISGNASRRFDQKSFQINAGKKYGNNRFDYPLFSEKEGRRVKSFLLRNGGQNFGPGFIKDGVLQSMTNVIQQDHQAFEPSVVYINGKYWGMLNIRERHNKEYIYSNYGWDETEIDIIENNYREQAVSGDRLAYDSIKKLIMTLDLTDKTNYEKIKQFIDMDSYINYMAVEIYLINDDWPVNNQKLFRNRNNGKFRWILQDLDKAFATNTGNKLKDLFNSSSTSFALKMITYLLKNDEFKEKYIDNQCLVAGSVFNPSRGGVYFDSIQAKLDAEWLFHSERWGFSNSPKNKFQTTIAEYKARFNYLRKAIFSSLAENFLLSEPLNLKINSFEPSAKITFNGIEIPYLPYEGQYFKDKKLTLTAPQYVNGKEFRYWSILKNGLLSEVKDISFNIFLKDTSTVITAIYDRVDSVRRGGLYLNEISASNAIFVDNFFKYEDWIEIYNASNMPINLAGSYLSNNPGNLELFQFSDSDSISTTVPANGYKIVWCSKETKRGVMHANFKLAKEGGTLFLSKKEALGKMVIIDSLTYASHSDDSSFGRYPDGDASIVHSEHPTFKVTNIATSYNKFIFRQDYKLVYGFTGLTPPTISNMVINNGELKTADSVVTVSFQTNESAFMYRISESPTFENAFWKLLETRTSFKLSPEYGTKTIYLQVKNALYQSDVSTAQIVFYKKYYKVVVGFSGSSTKNVTEIVNEEVLNNAALSFKDSYSALQLYNVWGEPAFKLAKKTSEISGALTKYGISEAVSEVSTGYNPQFTGDQGTYPDRYFSRAYFFGADIAHNTETRRLVAGFIHVPNGTYTIRILASQRKETPAYDYSSYRYQVNNSEIYIPSSDIFFNNQKNFIEFKDIEVKDSILLICSWREPFGINTGVYAPINLIEITNDKALNTDITLQNQEYHLHLFSGIGQIIVEQSEILPFTIFTIDGMCIKQITPESRRTEVNLPPGVYIISGKKVIAY